jgi:cytosine/creatinine deaminase
MDFILCNARLPHAAPGDPVMDIGVAAGRIAAIAPAMQAECPRHDVEGRLVSAGLIESHIHLDKACVLDRTAPEPGRQADAIRRTSAVKHGFTEEDVYRRACRVLERAVTQGTTRMRTHVELDPIVGLRGLRGVQQAIRDWAWAMDVEICVFPEEGLTNNPGTDELLVQALEGGVRVVGGAPGSDTDRPGQLLRVFELARRYGADIDLHIDFGNTPEPMDLDLVCRLTDRDGMGGRVAVAHVTRLSTHALESQIQVARRIARSGITLSVLPATDLFLMGRDQTDNIRRGVVNANLLLEHEANATLGSNNVLNAFTPFGDCSLLRLANLYANVAQVYTDRQIGECWDMLTGRAARMLRLGDYGLEVGNPADLVVFDAETVVQAVREIRQPVMAWKRGRPTMRWERPVLFGPGGAA